MGCLCSLSWLKTSVILLIRISNFILRCFFHYRFLLSRFFSSFSFSRFPIFLRCVSSFPIFLMCDSSFRIRLSNFLPIWIGALPLPYQLVAAVVAAVVAASSATAPSISNHIQGQRRGETDPTLRIADSKANNVKL